ncbi:MAG: hypothetical protein HZA53_16305 [Planctomycetes bacterium]|nr:hypothetical protein [Planctomycetota bacterium]
MTVRIVLVDSGVHAEHPHVREHGRVVASSTFRGPDERGVVTRDDDAPGTDELGHGTAAAEAILDLARGAEIVSLRVFERAPVCPFERVLAALRHALELDARFVNLSLGPPDERWREELERLGAEFAARGITVVSPAAERGLPMVPGALADFTGVLVDARRPRDTPELRASGARSYWFASPYPRDLPGLARARNLAGVSMAAANVTGFLARRANDSPT